MEKETHTRRNGPPQDDACTSASLENGGTACPNGFLTIMQTFIPMRLHAFWQKGFIASSASETHFQRCRWRVYVWRCWPSAAAHDVQMNQTQDWSHVLARFWILMSPIR